MDSSTLARIVVQELGTDFLRSRIVYKDEKRYISFLSTGMVRCTAVLRYAVIGDVNECTAGIAAVEFTKDNKVPDGAVDFLAESFEEFSEAINQTLVPAICYEVHHLQNCIKDGVVYHKFPSNLIVGPIV